MEGVSLSTSIFVSADGQALPLDQCLPRVAEAGYERIEISRVHPLPSSPSALAEHGLRAWAVHGALGGGSASPDEGTRRAAVESELARLSAAEAFAPCPYVIHYLNRFHDPRAGDAFRRSVEDLLRVAERLGIVLAVETAPDKPQNERYPDTKEVSAFVRSFGSPHASVCLDVNHSNLAECLLDAIENCRGVTSTIHVSDNHGEREEHLPPGQGAADLDAAMKALHTAGYGGPLNLECRVGDIPTKEQLMALRQWAEGVIRTLP